MPLDYAVNPPTRSNHDHIYTTLLGVLTFLLLLSAVSLNTFLQRPNLPEHSKFVFRMSRNIQICYALACAAVLVIRLAAPTKRKWVTLALNIILLLCFPFGTALAIYGLFKADRRMGQAENTQVPLPPDGSI
jgi:hypothetical protein